VIGRQPRCHDERLEGVTTCFTLIHSPPFYRE
jgi:hypothetical protein